jgi:hypothetical protein
MANTSWQKPVNVSIYKTRERQTFISHQMVAMLQGGWSARVAGA